MTDSLETVSMGFVPEFGTEPTLTIPVPVPHRTPTQFQNNVEELRVLVSSGRQIVNLTWGNKYDVGKIYVYPK